jgi:hypothetical protein
MGLPARSEQAKRPFGLPLGVRAGFLPPRMYALSANVAKASASPERAPPVAASTPMTARPKKAAWATIRARLSEDDVFAMFFVRYRRS